MTPMARRIGAAPMKKDAMKKMLKTMRFLAFMVVMLLGEEIIWQSELLFQIRVAGFSI